MPFTMCRIHIPLRSIQSFQPAPYLLDYDRDDDDDDNLGLLLLQDFYFRILSSSVSLSVSDSLLSLL